MTRRYVLAGAIKHLNRHQIGGWARYRHTLEPVTLAVYIDGVFYTGVRADRDWPAFAALGGDADRCGFRVNLVHPATRGAFSVALLAPNGAELPGSPKYLPAPLPSGELQHGTFLTSLTLGAPGPYAIELTGSTRQLALRCASVQVGDDQRPLGAAIAGLQLNGVAVPIGSDLFGEGFYGPDGHHRWTSGAGFLTLPPGTSKVELHVVAIAADGLQPTPNVLTRPPRRLLADVEQRAALPRAAELPGE